MTSCGAFEATHLSLRLISPLIFWYSFAKDIVFWHFLFLSLELKHYILKKFFFSLAVIIYDVKYKWDQVCLSVLHLFCFCNCHATYFKGFSSCNPRINGNIYIQIYIYKYTNIHNVRYRIKGVSGIQ